MAEINKKSLEHLADLARLELHERESEKFQRDLQKILDHFQELQSLDTEGVAPMTGGTELKNVFREDGETKSSLKPDLVVEQFPEKVPMAEPSRILDQKVGKKHWLKVPSVFEE